MSTTLLTLDQMLLEAIGDWLQLPVTTSLTTNSSIISTRLANYRFIADYYIGRRCYIEDYNNEGDHYITDDDGISTLTSATTFVAETPLGTELATFRLSRYPWVDRIRAIDTARKQIYPDLFRYLDNADLITGNILPPFNWATTATLDIYTEPSGTLLKNTTGTYIWRGSSSAKVTASGANDGIVLDSNVYSRLLDLMDKTVDAKVWVYPEVANDAFIDIITTDSAGTDTTKSSTTACPAGAHTLLEIEDYSVPDDIVRIQIKLRVHTDLKYAYFDQPRVTGRDIHEYLLPTDAQEGMVSRVYIQPTGYSDDVCDDLHPKFPDSSEVFNAEIFSDGTYKYLYLPTSTSERQIRLVGYRPLEDLLAGASTVWAANTITPDGKELELLITYAAHLLFEMVNGSITSDIDAIASTISPIITSIYTAVTAIDSIKDDIVTVTASIATVDTEIATEDTAITAVATDIATVISSIDTEMATVENVASEDISRYDAKIGRLDSKKKRLEDKRDALQDKRARLIVEKTALDDDVKRLEDKRHRLDDEITRFDNEKRRREDERTELKDKKVRIETESYKWLAKYRMLLPQLRMITPKMSMRLRM